MRESYGRVQLHRPGGEQHRLFLASMPAATFPLPEYKEHLLPDQVGAMVPHAISHAGSRIGPCIGHTLTGSRAPVQFDLAEAPQESRPPTVLAVGTSGSGKTVFQQFVLWQAFMQGSLIVDIDPKGDHRLRELPGVADCLEEIRLSGEERYRGLLDLGLVDRRFGWPLEIDKMLMISLGTGWWRMRRDAAKFMMQPHILKARDVAMGMVQDSSLSALTIMQALSEPRKPWTINSEIGDQAGESLTMGESLVFQRFDASLEADDVKRALNLGRLESLGFTSRLEGMRQLDNGSGQNLKDLYAIGLEAGRAKTPGLDGIEAEDFPRHFDPAGWRRAAAG